MPVVTYPWTTYTSPEGFVYYWNEETDESVWQLPEGANDQPQPRNWQKQLSPKSVRKAPSRPAITGILITDESNQKRGSHKSVSLPQGVIRGTPMNYEDLTNFDWSSCSSGGAQKVLKSGDLYYMKKNSWKKIWAVLKHGQLVIYKKHNDKTPADCLLLNNCILIKYESVVNKRSHAISICVDNKLHYLSGDTQPEMDAWVNAMGGAPTSNKVLSPPASITSPPMQRSFDPTAIPQRRFDPIASPASPTVQRRFDPIAPTSAASPIPTRRHLPDIVQSAHGSLTPQPTRRNLPMNPINRNGSNPNLLVNRSASPSPIPSPRFQPPSIPSPAASPSPSPIPSPRKFSQPNLMTPPNRPPISHPIPASAPTTPIMMHTNSPAMLPPRALTPTAPKRPPRPESPMMSPGLERKYSLDHRKMGHDRTLHQDAVRKFSLDSAPPKQPFIPCPEKKVEGSHISITLPEPVLIPDEPKKKGPDREEEYIKNKAALEAERLERKNNTPEFDPAYSTLIMKAVNILEDQGKLKFKIEVQVDGQQWTVYRREKQLMELHKAVTGLVDLPLKSSFTKFHWVSLDLLTEYLRNCAGSKSRICADKKANTIFLKFIAPIQMGDEKKEGYVLPFKIPLFM
eukprot:TRINITY_DN9398_c0_g1_i1.p1 TRINITY_DN9398_c0_g1~~TRINITY_DN9398_c0_g1_i1.p1  ORF type:complete len:626 (-),score=120.24 TRINITY_DN9398_c0_g1_i1:1280-3157(-)